MKLCWVAWLAVWGLGVAAEAQRLPGNVRPEHYSLQIAPDIAGGRFTGVETIDVVLGEASSTITLNALELTIGSVTAAGQSGVVSYDAVKEQATLTFARALPAGRVTVGIEYSGVLNEKLRGFYLSKSKTRSYAVTQFEATDARRAFPSFDEPALKATFDVALTVDAGDTAISNTNVIADTPVAGGKHTLRFATTPRMSTYLVAFLVGDFVCKKGKAEGVPIRVCSTPDKVKLTGFALSAAEHYLKYYDKYFGIKYPMPKLDLIAIPDFEAGAMENFGAITYRETELLLDERESTVTSRKRVAAVVAHEMAHQWFGDMVTMQWWDNLWLNEGFATWMESKAAGAWHPEWHFDEDVADGRNSTLNYDAAKTTRAIRATAETPAQIAEMFDGIAYGKAGAVIGMVERWVGAEVFRRGVHDYLAAHLYGNATGEDFWTTQAKTSGLAVDRVMAGFIDLPGVPLLTFGEGRVQEGRFFLSGGAEDGGGWTVPVCGKSRCALVGPEGGAVRGVGDARGYYRSAYPVSGMPGGLLVVERIGFLGDRWALTRAGIVPVGEYLDLALGVKRDASAHVLDTVLDSLTAIRNRIASEDDKVRFNNVVLAELGPVWQSYSKPEKDGGYERQQVRAELFQALGAAGDPRILAQAKATTEALLSGHKTGDEDLVDASVVLAAATGDEAFYDRLQVVAEKASDPGLQSEALETLAHFQRPVLAIRTLEYAVSGQVRNQDAWVLLAIELSQPETQGVAWQWVQKNWDRVKAQLTTASGGQLVAATGSFCTVGQREEVADFFQAHPVEAAERSLAKALDSIDTCVQLRATQGPKLHAWLEGRIR